LRDSSLCVTSPCWDRTAIGHVNIQRVDTVQVDVPELVVSSSTRPDERSYKLIWIWLYEVVAQNPDLMDTSADVTISRS
jgi:hypothetical protein